MTLIDKALWYLNGHFAEEFSLDDVARAGGVSRHYMAHAFGRSLGIPIMAYARGLRLAQAARELAAGAPDIIGVALAAGYGSHEAFTRAFREQFGLTPEAVRAEGTVSNLNLMEPMQMAKPSTVILKEPIKKNLPAMLIAGHSATYTFGATAQIPAQWQKFAPHLGHVPNEIGRYAYGVCLMTPDGQGFDYVCGVEVKNFDLLPRDFVRVQLASRTYLVFRHEGHVSSVQETWNAIMGEGLAKAGAKPSDGPTFERYGPEFDGRTGEGGLDICIPVAG
jgi:AraC family transcriptional regulator